MFIKWFDCFTLRSPNVYVIRSSRQRCSVKLAFLEISQNSRENTCARVSFLIELQALACNFVKKETLAQVFSREIWGISKNTCFTEHVWTTASLLWISKKATKVGKSEKRDPLAFLSLRISNKAVLGKKPNIWNGMYGKVLKWF